MGVTGNSTPRQYSTCTIRLVKNGMLRFSVVKSGSYTLSVRTLKGSEITGNHVRFSAGTQSVKLPQQCSAGAYIVSISGKSGVSGRGIVFYNGR